MVYRAIGLMSGSSLDGLDIVFAELEESRGNWTYSIKAAACYDYDANWKQKLQSAKNLSAYEYLLLHVDYGKYLAGSVNAFIRQNDLDHQVQLISSHGHTVFHEPQYNMTAQLGDGATIAALTGINVVDQLRSIDVALGGQGAPIVPLGEKLLLPGFDFYLNVGGIANISVSNAENFIAFDVCPANRVLNMLAQDSGKEFDEGGRIGESGEIKTDLLNKLNELNYYGHPYPKSLSNDFGTDVVFPLIKSFNLATQDALRTYTEHIALQVGRSIQDLVALNNIKHQTSNIKLLVTGGGAFNDFLIHRLREIVQEINVDIVIPVAEVVKYKEALVMALLGVLRWREENTVMASVTGAQRSSIGGAVWIGQEA
jgi:anhydro-N-acetylmuramic acid kinase